jgi:hypothetical protein
VKRQQCLSTVTADEVILVEDPPRGLELVLPGDNVLVLVRPDVCQRLALEVQVLQAVLPPVLHVTLR